jgi:hypothetical protein
MEALLQVTGYLLSVVAAGAIVVGIEALNDRCPDGPSPRRRAAAPALVKAETGRWPWLRQDRS